MTKRFYFSECCGICDNDKGESDFTNMLHSDEVVDLLNEQHEEIQRLEKRLEKQLRIYSDGLRAEIRETKEVMEDWSECIDEKKQLKEENEQLKQYIYDNIDENICEVCSYQYLEKSKMDKYYVAKCKKGYDNCSKGTVIHCKDFKFKELEE